MAYWHSLYRTLRCAGDDAASARGPRCRARATCMGRGCQQHTSGHVELKRVVERPVDGPHERRERAQVRLVDERLDELHGHARAPDQRLPVEEAVAAHLVHNVLPVKPRARMLDGRARDDAPRPRPYLKTTISCAQYRTRHGLPANGLGHARAELLRQRRGQRAAGLPAPDPRPGTNTKCDPRTRSAARGCARRALASRHARVASRAACLVDRRVASNDVRKRVQGPCSTCSAPGRRARSRSCRRGQRRPEAPRGTPRRRAPVRGRRPRCPGQCHCSAAAPARCQAFPALTLALPAPRDSRASGTPS